MAPTRLIDVVREIASLLRRGASPPHPSSSPSSSQPSYPTPGWQYDPPPRLSTYISRGGRIGLAVAAGLGMVLVVYLTLIGMLSELFLAEFVPGLDIILDCLTLVGSLVIAVVCYYAGMLGGLLVYAVAYARWRGRQTPIRSPTEAP